VKHLSQDAIITGGDLFGFGGYLLLRHAKPAIQLSLDLRWSVGQMMREKAYFPIRQIGEWLERICASKQGSKHCLSTLREQLVNVGITQDNVSDRF
jgi:hypothetical protein